MAEDNQVSWETIAEEEAQTDTESGGIKAELRGLKSVVNKLAKSRLSDKWTIESNVQDMLDKMATKLKHQQETDIARLQECFCQRLNEVRAEFMNKSEALKKHVDDLHSKLDHIMNTLSQLPSLGYSVPAFVPAMSMKQEKHQQERLHSDQFLCSKLQSNKSSTTQKETKEGKGTEQLRNGIRTNRNEPARMNNRNSPIKVDDQYSEEGSDDDVTYSDSEESEYDEHSPQLDSAQNGRPFFKDGSNNQEQYYRSPCPSPPQMETFHGDRSKWRTFIFQSEQLARVYRWSPVDKLQRLIACMRDRALEYLEMLPSFVLGEYRHLVADLNKRYSQKTPASISRHQLEFILQDKDEDLDDYCDRVHQLAVKGYPRENPQCIQRIAVDAFFRGCNNKLAAMTVMHSKPRNLSKAVHRLKTAIDHQEILGKPSSILQKEYLPAPSQQPKNHPDDLSQIVSKAVLKVLETRSACSAQFRQCFSCGMIGHFARNCPHRKSLQRRYNDPWKATVCFQCGHTGHFARACAGSWAARSSSSTTSRK